jgi:putative PIN family toxin of toxin-antitoxin system
MLCWRRLSRILRAKFAWSDEAVREAVTLLSGCTVRVQPGERLDVVDADPDDNRVLECAVAAGSRFIVTSDGDLLRLGAYAGIRILKVADFLELIREPPA